MKQERVIIDERDQYGNLISVIMPCMSDLHNHFRDGSLMVAITPEVIHAYRHMLAMPNTIPPILSIEDAVRYESDIKEAMTASGVRNPPNLVMTLYLANSTTPELIRKVANFSKVMAVKSYPPGATTNSDAAAPLLSKLDVLAEMEHLGVRLLIHGESTHDEDGNEIAHPDREAYFMKKVFPQVRKAFPKLKICLEHITTREAVEVVKSDLSRHTVCTITPQHAMCNEGAFNAIWGGVHARCMPYLKSEEDRLAIVAFMVSGDPRVILGTDCAPHLRAAKEVEFEKAACGCYTPHAPSMYLAIFEANSAVDERFVKFACFNGPDWWDLPRPDRSDVITFKRVPFGKDIPEPTSVPEEGDVVIPFGWTEQIAERLQVGFVQH